MSDKQPTCAERIIAHRDSRIRHIAELQRLANVSEPTQSDIDLARDLELDVEFDINDQAQDALYELPLCVSVQRVFRVDLSTGGPADWLEIRCAGGNDPDERYSVESITYHFADWFDHASVTLEGADFETAELFAVSCVPELA